MTGGDRDVHPVDVGDDADEEQEKENSPADASGLGGMGWWGQVHGRTKGKNALDSGEVYLLLRLLAVSRRA